MITLKSEITCKFNVSKLAVGNYLETDDRLQSLACVVWGWVLVGQVPGYRQAQRSEP